MTAAHTVTAVHGEAQRAAAIPTLFAGHASLPWTWR
jgi:hypothetical protein